jgi:hypothetical protein
MYIPPPTNAQQITISGGLAPITSLQWLTLFSSDADVAALKPLILAIAPDATFYDGNGIFCPPVQYGSDGRRVNAVMFTVQPVQGGSPLNMNTCIGSLIAQKNNNAMWNGERQPGPGGVYNTLYVDSLNDGGDAELDWGYVAPPPTPGAPVTQIPAPSVGGFPFISPTTVAAPSSS